MASTQRVLITGCSSGLGLSLARVCCERGYRVIATARNPASIPLQHPLLITAKLDVTDDAAIRDLVADLSRDEPIHILINNAGFGAMGPVIEMPPARLRAQFDTNALAPLLLAQAVAPAMMRAGGGLIVNIGSVSGHLVTPFAGTYCASKAALHALNDALRRELAPFNIRVQCILAGGIRSGFGDRASRELEEIFDEHSQYHAIADSVRERASLSQRNGSDADAVARDIVAAMERSPPRPYVLVAAGARSLRWLARLPTRLQDGLLRRRFGLNRL